ncbi:hypothetical protein GF327_03260 [Candidatus Woesearchaeota archaeon]|nr:hypothetical protein [Candidatus Woesearchaeota archaeon]
MIHIRKKNKPIVPPLSGGYMASSILGFFISAIYVFDKNHPWGLAFCIVFAIMFLSSVKSMTYADPDMFVALETGKKIKKFKNPFTKESK